MPGLGSSYPWEEWKEGEDCDEPDFGQSDDDVARGSVPFEPNPNGEAITDPQERVLAMDGAQMLTDLDNELRSSDPEIERAFDAEVAHIRDAAVHDPETLGGLLDILKLDDSDQRRLDISNKIARAVVLVHRVLNKCQFQQRKFCIINIDIILSELVLKKEQLEDFVSKGDLESVVIQSTLLEGVNLKIAEVMRLKGQFESGDSAKEFAVLNELDGLAGKLLSLSVTCNSDESADLDKIWLEVSEIIDQVGDIVRLNSLDLSIG